MKYGVSAAMAAMIMSALVAGCVPNQAKPTTYRVGNKTFTNMDDFVAEVRRDDDVVLAQVNPPGQRLGGTALVVVPSIAGIRNSTQATIKLTGDAFEAIVRTNDAHLAADAAVIDKGHIFDRVQIIRADDPSGVAMGEADYLISLDHYGSPASHWTLAMRGGRSHDMQLSPGTVGRLAWMNSLNIAVLNAAADLGSPVTRQALPTGPATGPISGTAFFIDAHGHALTNAHVVQGCKGIQMGLGNGLTAEAKVAASDLQNDLALLTVSPEVGTYARFGAANPRQGDEVVAYGFPLAGALSTQGTLSSGIVSALVGLRDDSRLLQISAPIQQGNSGGPLFDRDGHVIGVVSGKINAMRVAALTGDIPQNVNFAIKTHIVTNFLETNGVKFEPATGGKTMEIADIGDKAKAFTFMVTCNR